MPVTWCTDGGEEIALHDRLAGAMDAWFALVPCAGLAHTYVGACEGAGEVDLAVVWADPDDELDDGVLAARTYTMEGAEVTGERLVLDDVAFTTDEAVAAGECVDEPNLDLLLLHELGHWLGLEHACEDGEPCVGDEADAVMSWILEPCESRSLNAVDEALIRAVYASLTTPHPADEPPVIVNAPPFSVCVSLVSPDGLVTGNPSVTWNFGDGGVGDGLEACHTYTDEGSFVVSAEVAYDDCDAVDTFDPYAMVTSQAPAAAPSEDRGEPAVGGCSHAAGQGAGLALLGAVLAWARRRRV